MSDTLSTPGRTLYNSPPQMGDALNDTAIRLWYKLGAGSTATYTPGPNTSTTATTFATGSKTVAAADAAEALGTGLVEAVLILNRTGADIYWGDASAQTRLIANGDEYALAAVAGKKVDLASVFVNVGNDGDTVDFITAN